MSSGYAGAMWVCFVCMFDRWVVIIAIHMNQRIQGSPAKCSAAFSQL